MPAARPQHRSPRFARTALAAVIASLPVGCDEPDVPRGDTVRAAAAAAAPAPWLTEASAAAGIDFVHHADLDDSYFMPQIVGAGAAFFDYDGDGDLDVYLVNGSDRDRRLAAPPRNRLYRREADGTFVDVTDASDLGDVGFGMGVACGDYDNDGDVDVYVANYGADVLYRNDGDGTFTDVTAAAGIANARWSCSAAFLDYDRDGDLDLFAANYVHYPQAKVCSDDAGRPEFCGPLASPATPDVLYRNDGDGTFTDVSATAGIASTLGRGLGVLCEDFDDDGLIDVYVANDGEANFLWSNRGDGTFRESAMMMGVALNAFANTEASMGVTAGDLDNDGDLDLFMTHLARESNTLYRNDGRGGFADVTAGAGLGAPSRRYTGFGTAFADLDNDGWLDIAVVNGRVVRAGVEEGVPPDMPLAGYAEPNQLFANDGRGRFTLRAGEPFGDPVEVGRGLAAGDLDDDGGVDLLVTSCDGPARLYRNTAPDRGHWLIVRAVQHGRDAYGARVTVVAGDRRLMRSINPGYSYASSADPRAHFGLGTAESVEAIEVRWVDGRTERFAADGIDRVVTVVAGTGRDV